MNNEKVGIFWLGIFLGVIAGICIGMLNAAGMEEGEFKHWMSNSFEQDRVDREIGISTCEEKYGMEYDYFDGETLHCKPMKENYDGIRVDTTPRQRNNWKQSSKIDTQQERTLYYMNPEGRLIPLENKGRT